MSNKLSSSERNQRLREKEEHIYRVNRIKQKEREQQKLEREAERRKLKEEKEREREEAYNRKERELKEKVQKKEEEIQQRQKFFLAFNNYMEEVSKLKSYLFSFNETASLSNYETRRKRKTFDIDKKYKRRYFPDFVPQGYSPRNYDKFVYKPSIKLKSLKYFLVGSPIPLLILLSLNDQNSTWQNLTFAILFLSYPIILIYWIIARWKEKKKMKILDLSEFEENEKRRKEDISKNNERDEASHKIRQAEFNREEEKREEEFIKKAEEKEEILNIQEDLRVKILEDAQKGNAESINVILEAILPFEMDKEIDDPFDLWKDAMESYEIAYSVTENFRVELYMTLPDASIVPARSVQLNPTGQVIKYDFIKEKEKNLIYDSFLASFSHYHALRIFSSMPFLNTVYVEASVKGIDPKTGNDKDFLVLQIEYDKETFKKLKLEKLDPVSSIENFKHERIPSVNYLKSTLSSKVNMDLMIWSTPNEEDVGIPAGLV